MENEAHAVCLAQALIPGLLFRSSDIQSPNTDGALLDER